MKPSPVATDLKNVRKFLGLSQPQLALLLGVHPLTVSKWERGISEPSVHQQSIIMTMRMGHQRTRRDLNAWMEHNGWIATLSYLLASAYGFGPDSPPWRKVAKT